MEQVMAPPPLPPKTRRAPPAYRSTVLADAVQNHVVKIRINPDSFDTRSCVSVNGDDMIQKTDPYFYFGGYNCGLISSGQISPSDTLDSGTCSDLDGTPPPLPKKKSSAVTVTVIGAQHKRASSLTSSGAEADSDDNESSISYDSLNSGELPQEAPPAMVVALTPASSILPQGLLQDIRDRNVKLTSLPSEVAPKPIVKEVTYEERVKEKEKLVEDLAVVCGNVTYDADKFYNFHLNENVKEEVETPEVVVEDETFAGYKDLLYDNSSTIRSAKGTVRGVKNRVRAGIATFLQINSTAKNYKEKDAGKVVVYTTTMGIVRETYQACMKVKQILRTLLVKYEERDVFMSSEYQSEIRERMRCEYILVPQVFVEGQHVGDAETVERLNETGELRKMLKPYKSMDVCTTCRACGGYRLLPCPVCNGSKKSVHRNHFTAEFVALKCMNCDEVGLVRCGSC